ncbi:MULTISPECIES: lectin-like protein [unclassified Prochlorococcus]|uniref:lectin-like protein n=1 Tax=unclassified Prochlorococcus TaxID=2627481 RepID=UPI0039A4D694
MAVETLANEWPLSEWPATIKNVSKNGHRASCGCAACSQAGNPSSPTNINLDEGELYFGGLRSLSDASEQALTTDLIINEGSSISAEILEARYLYSNGGIIYLAFDYDVDSTRRDWWKDVIADADSIIEPEFAIVEPDNSLSQVNIYQAESISDDTAGLYSYWLATDQFGNPVRAQTDDEGQPVEYKIEIAEDLAYSWASYFGNSDEAGWKHVAYHELGHALGLEHPFDFNDGDGIEKGVLDINDSVMSYTTADDVDGSPTYTSLDREAIEKIYGAETGQVASAPNGVELLQDLWPVNTPGNFEPPVYTLTTSSAQVNEGEVLKTNVSTDYVGEDDASFFWGLTGENITAADFAIGSLAGESKFDVDGNFSFEHSIANDWITEGAENVEIRLFRDSGRTDQVGNTAAVEIRDTSLSPTYTLTTSSAQVDEGEVLTTAVSTDAEGLQYLGKDDASFFWGLSGKNIKAADFAIGSLAGDSKFDANGNLSFELSIANDGRTEGDENLEIKLFRDSGRTDQLGNTANVVIKDTSHSSDYVRRGDSAYVIVDGPTWEEAEANAIDLGGHLVSINDAKENEWLVENFKDANRSPYAEVDPHSPDSDIYWNGLTQATGSWEWSSEENLSYTNWGYLAPYGNGNRGQFILEADDRLEEPLWSDTAGKWNDQNSISGIPGGLGHHGIAEISLARSNQNIANQWTPNPQATPDSDLELSYSLHSTNGTESENAADLKQLAVLGDSVAWQNTYQLDITAESLNEGYSLETADITINFDPFLFNEIKASDITIGSQLPIANAVQIDNGAGTIRIAAASLGDLAAGQSISAEKVLASIELDFNEYRLDTLTQNANGKIIDPSTPLFFGLSANQDETVFSKDQIDAAGLSNREIKSLRELGGDLAVDGTKVTLYEAEINLKEQGDGLILSSDLDIGSYHASKTNLLRKGDTITATSQWTNVGNIEATDIAITAVTNDNASLSSSSFYISTTEGESYQALTNLESGSFSSTTGAFDSTGQETAQLFADIEITGAAGNVVDLSQGILSLKAEGSEIFENKLGSKNLITYQGDLNYDGRVSMKDLAYLNAGAARQQLASEGQAAADVNKHGLVEASVARGVDANFDGQISMADLAVLDADWGKSLHQVPQASTDAFLGESEISWEQLESQGTTGDTTWDNQAFKDQNALEAGNDFVESLESPGAVGVIDADGDSSRTDNDIAGDYFQEPPTP